MIDDMERPRRHSIRLKGFDYSQPRAYFVTICTHQHKCLFGRVVGEEVVLNDAGLIVHSVWAELPDRFPNIELDSFVVMPNHVHGIIILRGPESVGVGLALPVPPSAGQSGAASRAPTVGDVVCAFKSIAAINVNRLLNVSGRPLWQRNYYEHVIRNEQDLLDIRQYIANNPKRWALDRENPEITSAPGRSKLCPYPDSRIR